MENVTQQFRENNTMFRVESIGVKAPSGESVSFMDIEKKDRRERVRFGDGIPNPATIVSVYIRLPPQVRFVVVIFF